MSSVVDDIITFCKTGTSYTVDITVMNITILMYYYYYNINNNHSKNLYKYGVIWKLHLIIKGDLSTL